MALTLTLNKEFLYPVFYCFQLMTYCLLYSYQWFPCTPLQKLSKTASKFVKFPFFPHFGNCQKMHILTVTCYSCVIYLMINYSLI